MNQILNQEELDIIKEAYSLLKDIPVDDFITNDFTDKISKCCVVGHHIRLKSLNPQNYNMNNCSDGYNNNESLLRKITCKYLKSIGCNYPDIAWINNRKIFRFKQETPKERSMTLLEEIINSHKI